MTTSSTCKHGTDIYSGCTRCAFEERQVAACKPAFEALSRYINGGESWALATVAMDEHPTLLGQIAKGIATGVVRRADYNPEWKPFDGFTRKDCPRSGELVRWSKDLDVELPPHPDHDGRLDCTTVVGAIFMSRQSYI